MSRKFVIVLISIALLASVNLCEAASKNSKPAKIYTAREIPADPFLPSYINPQEFDISKGNIHISFKGVFRAADDFNMPTDWVYFAFTATPQKDMYLAVKQSELFDSKARIYKYHSVPDIAGERLFGRELIAGITVPVILGVNMPLAEAGEFPSVSRITITFNGEAKQFRNIIVEDWQTWQELREKLGL